jgi:hypothetical protein
MASRTRVLGRSGWRGGFVPSWCTDDHYGESDSPAARYQAAHDREFRVRMVEGTPAPGGWRRVVEPSCERCSYVIVDGACVGCTSLTERGQWGGRGSSGVERSHDKRQAASSNLVPGSLPENPRMPRSVSDERDAA